MHGITEADEMYLLESQKGSQHLTRPARKRGRRAGKRGISNKQVCILVARDRTGQTVDFVVGMGQLTKAKLHACLSITAGCVAGCTPFMAWQRATCRTTWVGVRYSTPGEYCPPKACSGPL